MLKAILWRIEKRRVWLDAGRLALAAEERKQEAENWKKGACRLNEIQTISQRQRNFDFSCWLWRILQRFRRIAAWLEPQIIAKREAGGIS